MKNTIKLSIALAMICALPGITSAQATKYKCMLQMTNYMGEGAYVVVSLIDAKGNYEKTLYVMGSEKKTNNISGITGASVTGGDRSMTVVEIDNAKINAGYKLRFETAVEDKPYYEKDAEVPLTTEGLTAKTDGTGYIRYVRFSAGN